MAGIGDLLNAVKPALAGASRAAGSAASAMSGSAMGMGVGLADDAALMVGAPLAEGVLGLNARRRREDINVSGRLEQLRMLKQQRLKRAMEANAVRLAAADPHLYQQLLAGQTLPDGAIAIGGEPRTDIIRQIAYDMATGGFEQRQPNDFLDLLS